MGVLVFNNPVLRQAWVVSAFANTRAGGAAAAAARPVRWRGGGRKGGGSITIASGQVGAQEPLQNRGTPFPQDCRSSSSCLTINRTILSGETVEHLGTIMVKGNVNSGAVICASGDIVILGQLEGEAHAGRSGDVHAIIFAWQLKSKTLSIAGCDAQGLASDRARFCEVALLSDGEIRIQDAADFSFKFASLQNEDIGKVQAGTLDSADRPWFAINLKSMRKPSQVAFFTGAYIFVLGAALLLFPEPLFGVFFDLKHSVKEWIRVGAVLAMVFGVYYIGTACGDAKGYDGARSFYMSTVIGRTFIFFIFSWLVAIGAAPLPLFIVGAVNLIGAVTMLNALRRPKMS